MIILVKLILAHLIADFLLQPLSWVKDKQEKKIKSPKLYLHVFIHLVLYFIAVGNIRSWYIPLIITISHLLIDIGKLYFSTEKNKRLLFFLDQLLHFIILFLIGYFFFDFKLDWEANNAVIIYLTGAIALTMPTSIAIKTLIGIYRPNTEIEKEESLTNAGKYIGILERLLVFVFIATNHWEGVGFLIAAKSIFRFSDLTQAKDRKLTEYILIGTLLSFGVAILVAIICRMLLFNQLI